jgi:hypothetical protein
MYEAAVVNSCKKDLFSTFLYHGLISPNSHVYIDYSDEQEHLFWRRARTNSLGIDYKPCYHYIIHLVACRETWYW